jgi:uncharacterized protein (DUF433 family)
MLSHEGVSLKTIRRLSNVAGDRFGTDYPLSCKRFEAEGQSLFAALIQEADESEIEDIKRCRQGFETLVRPFLKKLEYCPDADEAARYWPCGKSARVVLDPERKFGKPIDAETGVATRAIHDAANANSGEEPAAVAAWLGIPTAAVESALAFERSVGQ